MPTTRKAANGSTLTTASNQHKTIFTFPESHHLVITTPRHVFAWDSNGVHTIFRSRRGSIVAAREAKDGSGVIAVASSKVIVMHDTKRGKEESWGLNAPQDEVRHIEYTPDAKSLFLSTNTDGTIQRYSTERSHLVDPAQRHEAAPVALAISPTGHMILSASQDPPVVYLKNLSHNTAPLHIQPSASTSAVSFAAFHPERQNVFLLAFRDGTVAAYDATRTAKKELYSNQASVEDGEIARIVNAHRAVASGEDALCITPPVAGAVFLPGFKTRAITAGRDGKCKILDFANGGVVIRTWHARAPITSVSVLALKPARDHRSADVGSRRGRRPDSHTIGGPTSTDSLITVSRVDGKVQVYDSVGLLLVETTIAGIEERILSVEWAKGLSPAQSCERSQRHFSEDEAVVIGTKSSQRAPAEHDLPLPELEQSITAFGPSHHLGLPRFSRQSRQLLIHPDEGPFSTVRYSPSSKRSQHLPPAGIKYEDLFSPVKQSPSKAKSPTKPRITSPPPRTRPRLSSQTFVSSPEARQPAGDTATAQAKHSTHNSAESHTTPSTSSSEHIWRPTLKAPRRATITVSPLAKSKKHISFVRTADGSISSHTRTASIAPSNQNAKVLADLRKLSRADLSQRKHGTLSSYAISQRLRTSISTQSNDSTGQTGDLNHDPAESTSSRSFTDTSDDIWLTSDSDEDRSTRRRRRQSHTRPPGRLASRSRMGSKGTVSTTVTACPIVAHVDGSTEDDAFSTARSQLSSATTFEPGSDQVRALFPRSSSLSPGKKRNVRRSPIGKENTLAKMPIGATLGKQSRSPWARVNAGKRAEPLQVYEDADGAVIIGALPRSEGVACSTCPETKARVQRLEAEVAQLKGEVIALKAILRRKDCCSQRV